MDGIQQKRVWHPHLPRCQHLNRHPPTTSQHRPLAPKHPAPTILWAVATAGALAAIHNSLLFEFAVHGQSLNRILLEALGHRLAGITIILICFFALLLLHAFHAGVWGIFLWSRKFFSSLEEAIYFTGASVTGLGYGDVVLRSRLRVLGPLIAIHGLLLFGCSTAFLFLVMQAVWLGSLPTPA